MKRIAAWSLVGMALSFVPAGCVSNEPGSTSTAHTVIEYASAEAIGDELVRVFEAEGFELEDRAPLSLVFSRPATQRDIVLFGQYGTGEVTMRTAITIKPQGTYAHLVRADVQAVFARGGERDVGVIGSRPYQDMLDRVRASLVEARRLE